jgi:ABC-type sugar transport system substrate-binding protein
MVRKSALLAASTTKLKSLVITTGNLGTPFFVQIVAGAEARTREMGGSNVTVRPFRRLKI